MLGVEEALLSWILRSYLVELVGPFDPLLVDRVACFVSLVAFLVPLVVRVDQEAFLGSLEVRGDQEAFPVPLVLVVEAFLVHAFQGPFHQEVVGVD